MGNTLAHDLRTPLSRHRLELCAIADSKDLPITLKEKLESSIAKLDELVAMLQNILTISLAESRNTAQLFDEINLSDIVESITSLYEPIAEDKNIDLQTSFPAEAIRITGDRQLLGQAIGNLVDNAIKYTPEGGAVQLELRRHRGRCAGGVRQWTGRPAGHAGQDKAAVYPGRQQPAYTGFWHRPEPGRGGGKTPSRQPQCREYPNWIPGHAAVPDS